MIKYNREHFELEPGIIPMTPGSAAYNSSPHLNESVWKWSLISHNRKLQLQEIHCENAVFFVRMTLADTHLLKKVISGS